ncbi:hypothetical protein [Slackia isoflavoniconvertens]|uniref:hypothetical protein n=1 Tax=Slackia isoflavoniconvertens TaxID=572010 RepID=UPI001FCF08BB|nr:hypothetical protein [Slackia isoflavoniconvertens]
MPMNVLVHEPSSGPAAQHLHAKGFLVELDGCFLIEHVGAAVNELRFHALSPYKSNGCLSHFM